MNKKLRVTYLVLFLLGLLGINKYISTSWGFPSGDASIWFHSGLLMLILGSYWIEHHFSKPSDVVINGIVVFISISTLNAPPFENLWTLIQYSSLLLAIVGIILMYLGESRASFQSTTKTRRILYLVTTRFGNATVLFSAVFILALISYFDLKSAEIKWLLAFWAIVTVAKHLELDSILREIYQIRKKFNTPVGVITRFLQPNIVRFQLLNDSNCSIGDLVSFSSKNKPLDKDPLGLVIRNRRSTESIEFESILIESEFSENARDNRNIVYKLDLTEKEIQERIKDNFFVDNYSRIVGYATKETSISHLNFELNHKSDLAEGHLVSSKSNNDTVVLFQLTDGLMQKGKSIQNNERTFTYGEAEQVGYWNEEKQGFSTYDWVIPENSPIVHIDESYEIKSKPIKGISQIGNIPNSNYPVNININNLALYHSAILGVTGSGKSYLSFYLIEKCVEDDMKVICLDITGDYKRHLKDAVLLNSSKATKQFLNDKSKKIGIIEFDNWQATPTDTTLNIVKIALSWCKSSRTKEEIKEPVPKLLLVLEEAHALVPEWNFASRNTQSTVNEISKLVLQARKYGLGFTIITQRTANVTKSILNQCNTIFAFQAFDETGFEFLKNYMGYQYVNTLPNLKAQQCVVVGKASVSDRPLIVQLLKQERKLNEELPEALVVEEKEIDE